ncbi:MAG: hypothetical protein HQM08_18405 [Candidatus Riflebacteria bacterium]|nr:hypothetical protein [Candidatus Riflebacteria bacterium]
MRHRKVGRKFGRESHQRLALFRSLCTSLVKYEKIQTTLQKAKDLRRVIEKAITIAKKENALEDPRLPGYFHAIHDREIVGRDAIKKYLSNLKKETRDKFEKYLEDPAKNEKPESVIQFLASNRNAGKAPAKSVEKDIIGKDRIGRYTTSLEKEKKEKLRAFLANPTTAPKPEFVVNYNDNNKKQPILKVRIDPNKPFGAPKILRIEGILTKLVTRIAPRFKDVNGGYTRIYKLKQRRGDAADIAVIEFTR